MVYYLTSILLALASANSALARSVSAAPQALIHARDVFNQPPNTNPDLQSTVGNEPFQGKYLSTAPADDVVITPYILRRGKSSVGPQAVGEVDYTQTPSSGAHGLPISPSLPQRPSEGKLNRRTDLPHRSKNRFPAAKMMEPARQRAAEDWKRGEEARMRVQNNRQSRPGDQPVDKGKGREQTSSPPPPSRMPSTRKGKPRADRSPSPSQAQVPRRIQIEIAGFGARKWVDFTVETSGSNKFMKLKPYIIGMGGIKASEVESCYIYFARKNWSLEDDLVAAGVKDGDRVQLKSAKFVGKTESDSSSDSESVSSYYGY